MSWGVKQWENVLKLRGTIDPSTIEYAELRLRELRQGNDICYDEDAHNKDKVQQENKIGGFYEGNGR